VETRAAAARKTTDVEHNDLQQLEALDICVGERRLDEEVRAGEIIGYAEK
jgi:hypothetical protein